MTISVSWPPRHLWIPWSSAFTSSVLYILTVLYASRPSMFSQYGSIGGSSSNKILVLRVLSELGSLSLATTIAAAFERLQCLLVSQSKPAARNGATLSDYLGLDSGTGMLGLLSMAFGRRIPTYSVRNWGLLRLVAIVMIPLLNILIMGNVNTRPIFYTVRAVEPIHAYSVGNFNATLVDLWAPLTDMLFSIRFSEFLNDPTRSVEITDRNAMARCDLDTSCNQTYFVPGGIENLSASLINRTEYSASEAFTAIGQQGFVFDFNTPGPQFAFDRTRDCQVYSFGIGSWVLCLSNIKDNELAVKLLLCPSSLPNTECRKNTAWIAAPGWTTYLTSTHQRADISYSKLNGTVLRYDFDGYARVPTPINATQLQAVFEKSFSGQSNDSVITSAVQLLGRDPQPSLVPIFMWWYFNRLADATPTDRAVWMRVIGGIQSLLITPIYYSQSKGWAELADVGFNNQTGVVSLLTSQFPTAEPDVPIYPARVRYALVVGAATLVAYATLGGLSLLCCILVLLLVSWRSGSDTIGERSSFPTMDFLTKCDITDEVDQSLSGERLKEFQNLDTQALIQRATALRVVPASSTTPDPPRENSADSSEVKSQAEADETQAVVNETSVQADVIE